MNSWCFLYGYEASRAWSWHFTICLHGMVLRHGDFTIFTFRINELMFFITRSVCYIITPTCYRAHAQAAVNMQQQQQQSHTPGGLPPGMIHPASHSPLQLQPPGPSQPHAPGLYVGRSVAHSTFMLYSPFLSPANTDFSISVVERFLLGLVVWMPPPPNICSCSLTLKLKYSQTI
jgi:hypothetical protein